MTSIPPLLASAQTLLDTGFRRLDKAAADIQSVARQNPTAAPLDPTVARPSDTVTVPYPTANDDPLLRGIFETFRARAEVSAATTLVHTYNQMLNTLTHTTDPHQPTLDVYA
jgi:hypothetical protein